MAGDVLPLFFLFAILLISCTRQAERSQWVFSGPTMGTSWSVKIITDSLQSDTSRQTIETGITSQLEQIDSLLSTYRPDSELMEFNRERSLKWVDVSSSFYTVLEQAQEISQLSNGAFDVTVSPLVNLWGFGPELGKDTIPDAGVITQLLKQTGYQNLELDTEQQRIRKRIPELSVDLSSIAKGFAVDQVALSLEKLGVKEYLVEIGGELRAKGRNAANQAWRVGIETPTLQLQSVYKAIQLVDEGIATSGDYRNFYDIDGQRYSHTIDPETGYPVKHDLASVTVLAKSTMIADAWATALSVMGADKGYTLANQLQLPVLFIIRTGDKYTDKATSAFIRRKS
ncbi:MAG: FAD:protein FMN transferase [Gammaproteobacteria bacterium]|nr:FAD:protein FMN transferase [Gammaproteobacteria bacterium]